MGQSVSEKRVELYCSKYWILDSFAKDPEDIISWYYPSGEPRLLPEGEYLRFSPDEADVPYIYSYAFHVLDDAYWQDGNPRLEAQSAIIGFEGDSLIKSKMIELFTPYGAIGTVERS